MFNPLKSRRAKAAAAAAAVALGTLAAVGSAPTPAGADPQQLSAAIGMGSDTIQGVTNAYAGFVNGINYTPLQSSAVTGQRQIISFDALDPTGAGSLCVIPKPGAAAVYRPNGSGQGRKALAEANGFNGSGYGPPINGSANPCGIKDYGGLIDFARSSSGPASGDTGTDTTYIPMGRDAVNFAYYRAAGSPVTQLTLAQLQSIFTTGPQTIGGVQIIGCSIQEGSGTRSFWDGTVIGTTDAVETTATATCRNAVTSFDQPGTSPGRIEENNPVALKAKGDALNTGGTAGSEVIIGFSAANFIAKVNGVLGLTGGGTFPSTVGMGSTDMTNGGTFTSPTTGTAPNLAPNPTFYANTTFGRNVFYVLPSSLITNPGNLDIKSLFVGASASICTSAAQTTERLFGFETNSTKPCGDTTTKGSWITGNT